MPREPTPAPTVRAPYDPWHRPRGGRPLPSRAVPSVDRRQFLAGAGALAATPAAGHRARSGWRQPPEPPFHWGVASFDPTDGAVLLWTRVAPDSGIAALRWQVASDPDLTEVVASGTVAVEADSDHCALVDAAPLRAGGTWWYAFTAPDGTRSPVGRTRTMPVGEVDRLRLGVVACSRFASGGFAVYRSLAGREVDLVVHLGDYIYEDGGAGVRTHEPAAELRTLDQYRARYAQHRRDPDLQALHARHPMVAVWDDHEIAGNAWRDGAAGHDDARDGPWQGRLQAAGRAHEEWLPGRTRRSDDGRLRAWRALALGDLAELVVLDTRGWGRDRQPGSAAEIGGPSPADPSRPRTLLGADQEAFVTERLARVDRPPWVLLANQVMLHPLEVPVPGDALAGEVEAAGFLVRDGHAVNPDQWDGYPQARDALLAAVGERGGAVVLTGDVHSSWAWEGPAREGGDPAVVELVAPSVSSDPLADRLPVPAAVVEAALTGLSADLSYVELTSHGYLLVDLDADAVQGEWWFVDPSDAASARFGAARRAPISPPMHLAVIDEPLPDPTPSTGAPSSTTSTTVLEGAAERPRRADDPLPVLALGGGVAAVAAALGAAVALRRRTR